MTTPVKRAPKKRVNGVAPSQASKKIYEPGDMKFNWRGIYPADVKLFKFVSEDGWMVCLPEFTEPAEGEVFGLMLMNKTDQELLIHIMRKMISEAAVNPEGALNVTFMALQKMKAAGTVQDLLTKWPENAGFELGKY